MRTVTHESDMKFLRNLVALCLLAMTAAAFPPQQARSVVTPAAGDDAAPSLVADLVGTFGLSAPPVLDDTLNRWADEARTEWQTRQPVERSFTRQQIDAWTPVFNDLVYRIGLAISAPPLVDAQKKPIGPLQCDIPDQALALSF